MMNTKDHILATLRQLKPEIQRKYKVKALGVFGSIVRGEQTAASDIDVLVDFGPQASLFDLVGLGLFLEEKLGQRVDVVSRGALRTEIRETVLREVAPV